MPIILSSSGKNVPTNSYRHWVAITGDPPHLDPAKRLTGVGRLLEQAFDDGAEAYIALGREMSVDPTGELAHTPACAVNPSDMAQMLAWNRIVQSWAKGHENILLVCDDPWMFRAFFGHPGVIAAELFPRLWPSQAASMVRGIVSRLRYAVQVAWAANALHSHRRRAGLAENVILVYGHTRSTVDGDDGFFGDLMRRLPRLRRMLHVDCGLARARELAADGRSLSLHAWGNPWYAMVLPFARWRPHRCHLSGSQGWIIRRAAAIEGRGGTAVAIAWQRHCQRRWLRACRPATISWPWENHNWERALVREATKIGVRTAGYQHSVIGRQMLNHAIGSNPDGLDSIPDTVICNGASTRQRLTAWGVPEQRLVIGGALRYPAPAHVPHDPHAPVFLALPFDSPTAAQMVAAAKKDTTPGRRYIVKDHPTYGFDFEETATVKRTREPLTKQPGVSSVVYAATTVGLEAVLMGLPTLRFRPDERVAIDILPDGLSVPVTEAENLAQNLSTLEASEAPAHNRIFAPVDMSVWSALLDQGDPQNGP